MLTSAFPWNQDLPPSNPSILTSIESVSNDPFSGPSISSDNAYDAHWGILEFYIVTSVFLGLG